MYFQNNGDLEYIGVLSKFQNRGYGKVILNQALRTMETIIDQKPFLYCVESNSRALDFYLREGWFVTGQAACLRLKPQKP
jgi:GNAT superfamily N-acetyltransferase